MSLIYLAHPIDQAKGINGSGWSPADYREMWHALVREGLSMYDPELGWRFGGHQPSRAVNEVNRVALEQSSGVLARLPEDTVTLGTPVEIERALALGLPTAIVIDEGVRGVKLDHWKWLGAWVGYQWEEAVEWLALKVNARGISDDLAKLVGQIEELKPVVTVHGDGLRQGRRGDAGWDLVVSRKVKIEPGGFVDVHCDTRIAWPDGMWGWIVGRSSTLRSRGLLVNQGIIDQGYRGELMVGVWNLTKWNVDVAAGERIAQIIPLPQLATHVAVQRVELASDLPEGDRGEEGFGSSGL